MTEVEARTALRAFDGTGGLEHWLARQLWQVEPDGWTLITDLAGWRFRLQPIPAGLWVSAIPPNGGGPAVWVVPDHDPIRLAAAHAPDGRRDAGAGPSV